MGREETVRAETALAAAPDAAGPPIIANLQWLRACCALAILFFHTLPSAGDYGFRSPLLAPLTGWGFQGVDIFFLISGFVMVVTQERRQRAPGAFIVERLIRVAPSYWLLTSLLFLLIFAMPGLFRSLAADPLWYLRSMAFATILLNGPEPAPLLYVGWTLEYEMLFYLVFALSLGLPGWRSRVMFHAILLILLWMTFMGSIILEFLIGELCALYYLSGRRVRYPRLALLLGLIGLAIPVLIWPAGRAEEIINGLRFILLGLPAIGVILWALYARQTRNRLMLMIGDASYSIYLVQPFGISAFCKLFARLAPGTPAIIVVPAVILASVALGVVFFEVVERPVIRALRGRLARHRLREATQS